MATIYPDGSVCREGTRSVPDNFEPCCEMFDARTTYCVYDIRYEWWGDNHIWVIPIAEIAGGGGIEIRYCTHCGSQLTEA